MYILYPSPIHLLGSPKIAKRYVANQILGSVCMLNIDSSETIQTQTTPYDNSLLYLNPQWLACDAICLWHVI